MTTLTKTEAINEPIEHLIDLDTDPFIPDGWKVEEHQKGAQFKWDASRVALYLSEQQKNGKWIGGNKLREELAGKPVYNANLLDYLLANPHLTPEDWKKDEKGITRFIFFWGTIYRDSNGVLCVRYLYWDDDDGRWDWSIDWLGDAWRDYDPAAVPAS